MKQREKHEQHKGQGGQIFGQIIRRIRTLFDVGISTKLAESSGRLVVTSNVPTFDRIEGHVDVVLHLARTNVILFCQNQRRYKMDTDKCLQQPLSVLFLQLLCKIHVTSQVLQTKTVNKSEILKIAEEMSANDFINEFSSLLTFEDIDNLLDVNEGFTNVSIEVKDGRKYLKNETIFILFCDGKFDSYSN